MGAQKKPKKIKRWGVCLWRWLLKPGPAFRVGKVPGWGPISAPALAAAAVLESELLFQPRLFGPRQLAGCDNQTAVWDVVDSRRPASGHRPRYRPIPGPDHGRQYGQDRPCRYLSNDFNLAWRTPHRPGAVDVLSRHSQRATACDPRPPVAYVPILTIFVWKVIETRGLDTARRFPVRA
jgi:hypothetical protein